MQTTPTPDYRLARSIGLTVLLWMAISGLGALQTYSDNLRGGIASSYPSLLLTWFIEYATPLIVLCVGLNLALARRPAMGAGPRQVIFLGIGLILLFQPAQWAYIAWLRGYLPVAGWPEAGQLLMKMLLVGWFSTTGTFAAVLALHYWRQGQARELAWQRAQTDMLALRLALEHQATQALRAQLEPHFLFNALNAISALVRDGDKALALGGIGRLSELLRYALAAASRDSVSVADELAFVRDYLALQRLRYGARLQVTIRGDDAALDRVACPPLLLQPLVENALRHDLDCRPGDGDITLAFAREAGFLCIRVSNPASDGVGANPGAGLGLANTRARLALLDPDAALVAGREGARFVAEVRLPLNGHA
ncbi:sensor histidine kinase [Massilia sp. S19_KUP03_FR1]|uniref:sensor histidine kinase n=1 Tax=Massilia sp. S19_KUP03_FR1 TaxID=3025503 RepID=UPI002FCDC8E8